MKRYIPILIAGLLPVAFITGYLARGGTSTDTSSSPSVSSGSPSENSAEVGFTRQMTVHHAQAVDMAERLRARTSDSALRLLATDIVLTQQNQIGRFQGWLEQWNVPASSANEPMLWMTDPPSTADPSVTPSTVHAMAGMDNMNSATEKTGPTAMPGMASRADVNELSNVPVAEAERSFLRLMIRHHEGGVAMANAVLTRTKRPEVLRLAKSIITSQTGEIKTMKELLATRTAGQP